MLFSVVIPTYNRAALLREALDSVLAQSFKDFEAIVVDDGSTDDTDQVLRKYGDCVRIFRQQNKGAGAARNVGLRNANGEYLAFLDSDDVWFSWTLATYAEVIQHNGNPSFLTGAPLIFKSSVDLAKAVPSQISTERFPDYYASADKWRWFSASSFVIRRDRLAAVGGFHQKWGGEDSDLTMILGIEKGFVHLTAPYTFGYREHLNSLMGMPTYALAGSKLMLQKEKSGLYPGGRSRRRDRLEILTRHTRPVSLACLRQGMHREAWALYRATFGWHVALGRWRYLLGFPGTALIWRDSKNNNHKRKH